jgi:hypothetical protein
MALYGTASATVTIISDGFTDDFGGNRDNADPLDGVPTTIGGETWEANNVAFVQPDGVVTTTVNSGVRAFVPLAEEDYPVGATLSVKVDVKFEVIADKPIRFVQIGLVDEEVTNYSFGAGNQAISFILYFNEAWSLRANGVTVADQNHAHAQPLNAFSTTGLTNIELIYDSMKNTVKVLVNGSSVLKHDPTTDRHYNLSPFFPDPGMAGFNCSTQVRNVIAGTFEDAPAGAVQFDNFEAKADDSTKLWEEDGPYTYGGKTYYLLSPSSWGAAQAYAQRELGGNLVTVETNAEHAWIFNKWGTYDVTAVKATLGVLGCGSGQGDCELCDIATQDKIDGMWIGYSRPDVASPWVWSSGSASSHTNWAGGHPADSTTACPESGAESNYGVLVSPDFNATGQWWSFSGDGILMIMGVVEVQGHIDNGFNSNYMYAKIFNKSGDPFGDGSVRVLDQTTGEALGTIQPAGTKWHTLTFSGTGSNDTRLFMAKEDDVDIADIIISEIDSAGNTVVGQDTSLKAIFASSAIPYPADHGDVGCWNMRYSQSHDSLFLAVNPHQSNAVQDQATIHEINLELDTVLNTYQAGLIDDSALVYIDIDGHNDRIYVGAKTLVSANSGIVAVDTPGGALTTLIDGSRAGGLWSTNPFSGLVFRNNNNPENAKTLMVVFGPPPGAQYPAATLSPVSEYYLDQVDGNGDLLLRQEEAYQSVRYPGTAQLDEVEGTTMQVRYVKEQGSMRNAGIDQYTAEDVHYRPPRDDAVNQELLHSGWEEVDSPGFNAIGVVPVAEQYALGYEGDASTPSSFDYVVRNKGYSGNISYTVAEDVDEPWLTLSKAGGGPIAPGTADSAVTALIDSTSLTAGFYTANLIFTDVNDSTNVFVRTITVEVKECGWTVKPETTQSSKIEADMTVFGRCTDPTSYDFTVTSLGGADVSYTVDEVLSDGVTGTDYDWLDLAKAGGGPIPSGSYDTLTVTVTSDDTDKTAYLRFTPSCGISSTGVGPVVRRIDVTRLVTSDLGEKAFKHAYLGDVDPMAVDSCGVGCTFEIHTAVNSKNEAVGERGRRHRGGRW